MDKKREMTMEQRRVSDFVSEIARTTHKALKAPVVMVFAMGATPTGTVMSGICGINSSEDVKKCLERIIESLSDPDSHHIHEGH